MLLGLLLFFYPCLSNAQDIKPSKNPLYAYINEFSTSDSRDFEIWHQTLSVYDAEALTHAVQSKDKLDSFSLPFCQLNDTNCTSILYALSQRQDLRSINLRGNELCRMALEPLALITLNNPNLESLNLSGNCFALDEFATVISNLQLNSKLQSLDIHSIPISKKTTEVLIAILPTLTGLQRLDLALTQLSPGLIAPLLSKISFLSNLQEISLCYENLIGYSHELVQIIKKCPNLKKLDLRQCQLSSDEINILLATNQQQLSSKYSFKKTSPKQTVIIL